VSSLFQPHGDLPLLMGIVNVTPDSFSDGGRFVDPERAVEHALHLESEGAAILDIGGESTRPGAAPVDAEEELRRVLPVIEQLVDRTSKPISIDTSKATIARAALSAGARIVNDVTGLEGDPEMLDVVASSNCGVCVMHMSGEPRTMQVDPQYDDVVAEVKSYLAQQSDVLIRAGIDRSRICLDPGIGFGKTYEHNFELLRRIDQLHELGCPLLVGHSKKRFLGELLGDPEADRKGATIGVAMALAALKVQVIRVHDVRPIADALTAFAASGGL
jgi:dihydropteroate synthase